jgi:hypothetical protein
MCPILPYSVPPPLCGPGMKHSAGCGETKSLEDF